MAVKAHPTIIVLKNVETKPLVLDWSLACRCQETILARDYWFSRCRDERVPARGDLSPRAMKPFMPHVGLVEVRDEPTRRDYFVRLAGTKWERVFGSMRGKLLHEFLPKHIEDRWRQLFDPVCEAKKPVRMTTRIAFEDKAWLATEMFVAPLSEDGTIVSMLFLSFTSWSVHE